MKMIHKLRMDLQNPGIMPMVHVVQDDRYSRTLEFTLLSGRRPFPVPEDALVLIRYSKPDGRGGSYDTLPDGSRAWAGKGNRLTVILAPQVLTVPGPILLSVIMLRGDTQLGMFPVQLVVQPTAAFGIPDSTHSVTGFLPSPETARAGQYFRIAAVDERGKVSAVEAVDAAAGGDTVTPCIGENGNWYLGSTDTGKPSRGEAGPQGEAGPRGEAGPQGEAGADGISPQISVRRSGKVTTITITDAQGTQSTDIYDGADGEAGSGTVDDGSVTPEKTSFIRIEGTEDAEVIRIPNFTNLADPGSGDWKWDTRFSSSSGSTSACEGAVVTNAIGAKAGDVIRIRGLAGGTGATASALFQLVAYSDAAAQTKITRGVFFEKEVTSIDTGVASIVTVENGITTYTLFQILKDGSAIQHDSLKNAVAVRVAGVPVEKAEDIVITVNEPITYTEVTGEAKRYTLGEEILVSQADCLRSGARWFALGDSITQGYYGYLDSEGTGQYACDQPEKCWASIVADMNGYLLTNYAVGGTGYAHHTSGTVNARAQVAGIDFSGCDLVTLAFGVNDWKGKAALGSMEDDVDTVDAFVPNMRYVIRKILADNPCCKIFVITPLNCRSLGTYETNYGIAYAKSENASGPGLEDIFQLEKAVCDYHGIELIDMTHGSVVNRENITVMLPDRVHPSLDCHTLIARELAQRLHFR